MSEAAEVDDLEWLTERGFLIEGQDPDAVSQARRFYQGRRIWIQVLENLSGERLRVYALRVPWHGRGKPSTALRLRLAMSQGGDAENCSEWVGPFTVNEAKRYVAGVATGLLLGELKRRRSMQ